MKRILSVAAVTLAMLAAGCGSRSGAPAEASRSVVAEAPESVTLLFDAYEALRVRLASDEQPAAAEFNELGAAARHASSDIDAEGRESLEALAAAAESAASATGQDLPAARSRFGEISEKLIAFLALEPDLTKGRFIFECPMTKTYSKWVQQSDSISNPYMGLEMGTCGSTGDWRP